MRSAPGSFRRVGDVLAAAGAVGLVLALGLSADEATAQPAAPSPGAPAMEAGAMAGGDDGGGSDEGGASAPRRTRLNVELKRQNTSRGTADESTRTTLRVQWVMPGPVRLFRIDLPFPDERSDFSGDPFNPRPGDLKLRLGFRPLRAGDYSFPSFVELTLPTADPPSLGSGHFQFSGGLRMLVPLDGPGGLPGAPMARFETELQQVVSFGGDPARKDIRYTKLELSAFAIWHQTLSVKLKLKPSVDWVMDGRNGAVGEIEGGMVFDPRWRGTLMLGRRLWGPPGIGGTYDYRIELTLSRLF